MAKPSYAEAIRQAKGVKLNLASGAEGSFVSMSAQDRARLYDKKYRAQGETEVDIRNRLQYTRSVMRDIFG